MDFFAIVDIVYILVFCWKGSTVMVTLHLASWFVLADVRQFCVFSCLAVQFLITIFVPYVWNVI